MQQQQPDKCTILAGIGMLGEKKNSKSVSLELRSLRLPPSTKSVCSISDMSLAVEHPGIFKHELYILVNLT